VLLNNFDGFTIIRARIVKNVGVSSPVFWMVLWTSRSLTLLTWKKKNLYNCSVMPSLVTNYNLQIQQVSSEIISW